MTPEQMLALLLLMADMRRQIEEQARRIVELEAALEASATSAAS